MKTVHLEYEGHTYRGFVHSDGVVDLEVLVPGRFSRPVLGRWQADHYRRVPSGGPVHRAVVREIERSFDGLRGSTGVFVLSIEPTYGATFREGFHLGEHESFAREEAIRRFHARNASGLATRTVALIRDRRVFDVYDGRWASEQVEELGGHINEI